MMTTGGLGGSVVGATRASRALPGGTTSSWRRSCARGSLLVERATRAKSAVGSARRRGSSCLRCQAQQGDGPGAFTPELKTAVDRLVGENKIVLFMKGTKMFPQCGFSNTCVQIFNQLGAPFEDVNVLEDERIRVGMKEYSQWPTFPQIYIEGEFYGGCDILLEAYQSGELEEYIERVLAS